MLSDEKKQAKAPARNPNLDLIRCVAVLCVVSVHFFWNTEYYNTIVAGKAMVVMTFLRTVCMVCVPLFVLLTGYLCCNKTLSRDGRGYYRRILPILGTYFLACVLSLLYQAAVLKKEVSAASFLRGVFQITGGMIRYGWYIEMYIGLFLLIPFLNAAYGSLAGKKEKHALFLTLLTLTMLPNALNYVNQIVSDLTDGWVKTGYVKWIPMWWSGFWPITYYFTGAYLREYGAPLSKRGTVLLLCGCILAFGGYNCYCSRGIPLSRPFGDNWGGLQCAALSVLVFMFLLRLELSRLPKWIGWLIRKISELSLGIYLCSSISDNFVYQRFGRLGLSQPEQLVYMPAVVLGTFLMAAIMSQMIAWIQVLIKKGGMALCSRFRKTALPE